MQSKRSDTNEGSSCDFILNPRTFERDDFRDNTSNEITIRLATAKTGFYAIVLINNGGSFPNGSSMILTTTNKDYYFQSGVGQISFTVSSDNSATEPLYKVRVLMTGSGGTAMLYGVVTKFT
jgi:hypothetical protein